MLLDSGWRPVDSLKALCGGEPLPVALADRLLDAGVELWNMYGPTETTIWSTCKQVTTQGETLTIGRPIANTTIYILDRHRQPVPVGAAGELWIGGHGLARGYRGRDDLTAERFIPDPFESTPGARIYLTGDLARYRPDGEIEFLGRIDNQVKVRGFRIELGEIETVLTRHPQVTEAVVTARGEDAEAELAAYVIVTEPVPSAKELRDHAGASLTPYMVPSTVTFLDAFPLTPNGKVDRKALPEPDRSRAADHELVEPRTEIERRLAEIWERQLQISPIGVTDDFFDLGVSSLTAANLFGAIEHELGGSLPLGAIFRAPTIESLANLLEGEIRRLALELAGSDPASGNATPDLLHPWRRGHDPAPGRAGSSPRERPAVLRPPVTRALRRRGAAQVGGGDGHASTSRRCARCIPEAHGGSAGTASDHSWRSNWPSASRPRVRMWNCWRFSTGQAPPGFAIVGHFANQPLWRERHGHKPITNITDERRRRRRRRRIEAVPRIARRAPRALFQPKKIAGYVNWVTRKPRTALALRRGRPIPEQLREAYFLELHGRAERAYRPEPWDGDMIVFYGQQLYEDPTLGWSELHPRRDRNDRGSRRPSRQPSGDDGTGRRVHRNRAVRAAGEAGDGTNRRARRTGRLTVHRRRR